MILLIFVILGILLLSLTPTNVISKVAIPLMLRLINHILADSIYFLVIFVSLFTFLIYKIKIKINKNGIIYEFHRFKWKSKLIYKISQEEFVLTSINKILDNIPKLILSADVIYLDKNNDVNA